MKTQVIESPAADRPTLAAIRNSYRDRLRTVAARLRAGASAIERGEIPEDYGIQLSAYVDDIDVCADALRTIARAA